MSEQEFSTPMMQQYTKIKADYPDALLFFRMGDFYELFLEDAEIGAEVLDITLTARGKGTDGKIPMCGVPFHSVDSYIARLVNAGYKVAVCEQMTEPGAGSKIVEREVIRVVTPATILDESAIPRNQSNYLMVLDIGAKNTMHVAFVDIGTADFQFVTVNADENARGLEDLITKFGPRECIVSPAMYDNVKLLVRLRQFASLNVFPFARWSSYAKDAEDTLKEAFHIKDLEGLGLKDMQTSWPVLAVTVGYLQETQKGKLRHLGIPRVFDFGEYLYLDRNTMLNLELFRTVREGEQYGSLIWLLDKTKTAMGARLLRNWVVRPLRSKELLEQRYDTVAYFKQQYSQRESLQRYLEQIVDIERTYGRLSVGVGNARDLVGIRQAFEIVASIVHEEQFETPLVGRLASAYTPALQEAQSLIARAIKDEPAATVRDGNMVREGYNAELDELRGLHNTGKAYLADLQERERVSTGIGNLKIGFNKVFGYYIEISKSHLAKVPDTYIRKQTLVNAERFITQELKEYESKVLTAQERMVEIEYTLVQEVIAQVVATGDDLYRLSKVIAELDVLVGFAQLSHENEYVRPELSEGTDLHIVEGRHPVIEKLLTESSFVPNDTTLNSESQQILLLTGPNMAGKSTYVRQVALVVLLAQIGCFVPCREAKIGIVDKLFTRIGAADNLSRGLSTFMVEMVEVANILNQSTDKSLIVLDEVGRGTSTYDGVSIAWSVVEYLANGALKPKTLFATHFHELLQLADSFEMIKNYQVVVETEGDDLRFLHRVMPGGTDKSYGIEVAKRAGLPKEVTDRAKEILAQLERKEHIAAKKTRKPQRQDIDQMGLL